MSVVKQQLTFFFFFVSLMFCPFVLEYFFDLHSAIMLEYTFLVDVDAALCINFAISAPLNYPVDIKIYPHSDSSVRVRFRGVNTGIFEEPLLGYKVSC